MFLFNLTLDATENFHYPELVGVLLKLQRDFIFPQEQVTELLVMGNGMSSDAVDKIGFVKNNSNNG